MRGELRGVTRAYGNVHQSRKLRGDEEHAHDVGKQQHAGSHRHVPVRTHELLEDPP